MGNYRIPHFVALGWLGLAAVLSTAVAQDPEKNPSLARTLVPVRGPWLNPDGKPLSFESDDQLIEFLETAEVVSSKYVSEGINGVQKILLDKDGMRLHAAFREVVVSKFVMRLADGTTHTNFRDDCMFEIAAYRLSRLLGLDSLPPVVERKIRGKRGSLQVWVENAMMEKKRWKEKIQPPERLRWTYQWQVIHIFDNLIHNDDRNLGNILIDSNWKLWMIDHTRAFRRHKKLQNAERIRYCPRSLFENLKSLEGGVVERELKEILRASEIEALLARRDLLVARIEELIARQGAGAVLF